MNIYQFEEHVNQKIVTRGWNYFCDGRVSSSRKRQEGTYTFFILGSEKYEVTVTIGDEGTILFSSCNCPYDYSSVCKHEVAAYFELAEQLDGKTPPSAPQWVEVTDDPFTEILQTLSNEVLIEIVRDLTERDEVLKRRLLAVYSKGEGDV
ncbi:SWIM zinc finger family protein [Sporosarcina newyorkensis]|uniref:SWIM-type domain-containing protein n=1 Tax=Sporosarcina newyorkensis 2681 TaxID=1027292 RepID=F9DQQ2_9BACL|nr:hypothetical protein [Sporosarcina newyorkensis]EGQ26860.1 hypothetical protein HMPREF9372_1132 [Sporosarcina newyorkensis 2681]